MAKGALTVSHELFADDCYLFCRAKETEVHSIVKDLQIFQNASGQQVNLSKSLVFSALIEVPWTGLTFPSF